MGKGARQLKAGAMPPDGVDRPTDAQRTKLVNWLQHAVVYVDPKRPVDPGKVTIRRLNRTEYNNTIRDLFGVEMKLANDFPDDDVGYGFDNIGDVLAISPLRMEQYLNAALRLTACLLGKSDGFELDATTEAVFFERTKKARNNSDRGLEMVPESELYLDFEFPAPGEYEMRIYAWGVENPSEKDKEKNERWLEKDGTIVRAPDAKPVIAAELLCDDDAIGVVDVYAGNGTTALKTVYSVRFLAQAGIHTLRIRHRFPEHLSKEQIKAHLKKPQLAPRLGMRRIGIRGPYSFNGKPKALVARLSESNSVSDPPTVRPRAVHQRPAAYASRLTPDHDLWISVQRGEQSAPRLAGPHQLLLETRPNENSNASPATA